MIKLLLLIAGWFFLVTGLIGIVLPILPTTPFILLSTYCFSRSSSRLHNWLINHPHFGPAIKQWQQTHTVSRNTKTNALYIILITFTVTLVLTPLPGIGKAALLILALVLIGFIAWLPERAQSEAAAKNTRTPSVTPSKEEF